MRFWDGELTVDYLNELIDSLWRVFNKSLNVREGATNW